MPVARLLIEYDGTAFAGWAAQPAKRTVQDELERSLAVVHGRDVALTVAGRTDAGVHALAQVASYEGEPVRVEALNALLPDDVAVLSCEAAPTGFDARRDATSRAYCYRILHRPGRAALERSGVLHWPGRLDSPALEECARRLVGAHDFTAFTPTETYHVRFERRVLAAEWRRGGHGRLTFWIEADTFMRHMNRVLVGTMLEVASGQRSAAEFAALLDGAPRSDAGRTAPARGLYLAGVGYDGERVMDH